MGYWAEVRNNFMETDNDIIMAGGDILAAVSIDGWKTMDDNEPGDVIACVMLSKHGDILVDYRDSISRTDKVAQEAIKGAFFQLEKYYKDMLRDVDGPHTGVIMPLGNAMYMDWEDIDRVLNRWARNYFGEGVSAEGNRDEESFEISLHGLDEENYQKYYELFEKYDANMDYEPDDMETVVSYSTFLPSPIAWKVMFEALDGKGLAYCGAALATYSGVYFTEKHKDDVIREVLSVRLEEAKTRAGDLGVQQKTAEDKGFE